MSIISLLSDKIKDVFDKTPELSSVKKDKFELAVAQMTNVKYLGGLDLEDLVDGVVGGGGDEGIDMCYLFHNDEYISNDEDLKSIAASRSSNFEVNIIQAKAETGFSTNAFGKLCEGVVNIITVDEKKLKKIGINGELMDRVSLIRQALKIAKREDSGFILNIYFVTQGDSNKLSPKIEEYTSNLRNNLRLYVENINFNFLGAEELLNIATLPDEKIEFNVEPSIIDLRDDKKRSVVLRALLEGRRYCLH